MRADWTLSAVTFLGCSSELLVMQKPLQLPIVIVLIKYCYFNRSIINMQTMNREAFERKISKIYDQIEKGDFKKAMKKATSLLEKGGKKLHPIERLSYQLVKVYTLDRSNRR